MIKLNYFIEKCGKNFLVIERSTDQLVGIYPDSKRAKERIKQLNSGCGFDGWTPAFILQGSDKNPRIQYK